ncbi:MAG: hypothetical protein LBV69_00065 [Bacteroidales bacterium]|jgi:hypothetical protein|nr:hypothetical protein [Bacteroidales bacterium]
MIGGLVKYFRFPIDYILYDLSYENMLMLNLSIPSYDNDDKDKDKDKKIINADNEENNELIERELFR